jgi:hypothetical protein
MITSNATKLQDSHIAPFYVNRGRVNQARYAAAEFEAALKAKPLPDKCVVLDSTVQRVFRMRKGILTASRLINARLKTYIDPKGKRRKWVPVMVTLTYADSCEWAPDHISKYIHTVSEWGRRRGYKLPYVWVMELTKKGRAHYHVIFWIPVHLFIPKADVQGWWVHGSSNTVRARNPYGYLSKYASKALVHDDEGKRVEFPRGARIHGIGGVTADEAAIIAWWKLPKDLRRGDEGSCKWRRHKGGGWVCIEGDARGEIYVCNWGLSAINVKAKQVRLVEKSSREDWDAGATFGRDWASLVAATASANYAAGQAAGAAAVASIQTYRRSWIWQGGGPGFVHPTDVPMSEGLFPGDQQGLDRFVQLVFSTPDASQGQP